MSPANSQSKNTCSIFILNKMFSLAFVDHNYFLGNCKTVSIKTKTLKTLSATYLNAVIKKIKNIF